MIFKKNIVNEEYHVQGSNSKFLASFKIPVFFHNSKGYDGHLIIDKAYLFGAKSLNIIPMSAYKYLSFQIGKLHFKDSMNFLNSSLHNLVNNLNSNNLVHLSLSSNLINGSMSSISMSSLHSPTDKDQGYDLSDCVSSRKNRRRNSSPKMF